MNSIIRNVTIPLLVAVTLTSGVVLAQSSGNVYTGCLNNGGKLSPTLRA